MKNIDNKMAGKDSIKVDLILQALLDEACVDQTPGMILACKVLETLELVEGSECSTNRRMGGPTTHYMFIATDNLREILVDLGLLIDTMA